MLKLPRVNPAALTFAAILAEPVAIVGGLKVSGRADLGWLSWWWVTAPLWGPPLVVASVVAAAMAETVVHGALSRWTRAAAGSEGAR